MSDWNRRDVFRAAAAGAALAGGAGVGLGQEPLARHRTRALAAALARHGVAAAAGTAGLATVTACRSWDGRVHLQLADGRGGLCAPEPRGFALAAAAQAAGRPVHVRCWGHDADAEGGVGCFAGVLLALDPADLAGDDDRTHEVQP